MSDLLYNEFKEYCRYTCKHVLSSEGLYLDKDNISPSVSGPTLEIETVYKIVFMDVSGNQLSFCYSNPVVKDKDNAEVTTLIIDDEEIELRLASGSQGSSTIQTEKILSAIITEEQALTGDQVDSKRVKDRSEPLPGGN